MAPENRDHRSCTPSEYTNGPLPAMDACRAFIRGPFSVNVAKGPRSARTPSLLDAIDAWLLSGDATEHCVSYEHYLLTVISLIATWADKGSPYDLGFWDDSDDGARPVIDERTPVSRCGNMPHFHRALSRTTWDLIVSSRRR